MLLSDIEFKEKELIGRVMRGMRSGSRRLRWAVVSDVFALGSTCSIALCKEIDLDPDEYLEPFCEEE